MSAAVATIATYYGIFVTKSLIDDLNSSSPESDVSEVWLLILGHTFPQIDGYSTSCEVLVGGGLADLLTKHTVQLIQPSGNNRIRRFKFLVIEYKAVRHESQSDSWTEGAEQLQQYLSRIHVDSRRSPQNQLALPYNVYGAVAVGRYVRFYTFDRQTSRVTPVQNYDRPIHIANEHQTVQHLLNYVKDDHS